MHIFFLSVRNDVNEHVYYEAENLRNNYSCCHRDDWYMPIVPLP